MLWMLVTAAWAGGLVVHEWGTFTAVTGEDGVAVDWHPLEAASDLPGFVYDTSRPGLREFNAPREKGASTIRMETPVIYFHTDEPVTASVRVDFPSGHVTEWYPHARQLTGTGVDWGTFSILPNDPTPLPHDGSRSHYYPARAVDAATVRVCDDTADEHERFLFYRGVGRFDLSLRVTLEGDLVVMKDRGGQPLGKAIVYQRSGDRVGWTVVDLASGAAAVPRPWEARDVPGVLGELEGLLVAEGLYRDEARAMVKTWEDHWFEEGLRVFYVLPRAEADALLPLQISPAPAELVRVLVGRVELVPPETENLVRAEIGARGTAEAVSWLEAHYGRFGEPIVRRLAAQSPQDPAIEAVLGAISPP